MIINKTLFKDCNNKQVAATTLWTLESLIFGQDVFKKWWKVCGDLEEYEYSMPGDQYEITRFRGSGWFQDDFSGLFVKLVPTGQKDDPSGLFKDVRLKVLPLGLDWFYTCEGQDWQKHYNKDKAEIIRKNLFKV